MNTFNLSTAMTPAGDQPKAIAGLVSGIREGMKHQTLLGVTGSGKTFTIANVIAQLNRPTLVIAHNKTLAAQLCNEYREFFPHNAVEYFVSYYDYYQPEAYIASSDTYIEKEAMINEEIDRLRHRATQALLSRRDVIVVASVSCIYNIGSPEEYKSALLYLHRANPADRHEILTTLVKLQFTRTTADLARGTFRSRGNIIEIMPKNEELVYRIEMNGSAIDAIVVIDPVTRTIVREQDDAIIFPSTHFVMPPEKREQAFSAIRAELDEQVKKFTHEGKFLEAERIERRTRYDLEMMAEIGYCHGIENYSRHLSQRPPGERPEALLDYFPKDFLLVVDESHVTIPQIGGMYAGDAARKKNLIDYGFRLPSAADNRPLRFDEFESVMPQTIYTSATPGAYEKEHSEQVVEQIIRPTGLLDPLIEIRPIHGEKTQVVDLLDEIDQVVPAGHRVMVTTLTKKMAEDLSGYLAERKIKANYLHSDVETLDRIRTLTDFRRGEFDVLVGVNLLREGLDLPEVALVAILDADKEGFLRSETSLIQTIGRAARNVDGRVILYADHMTRALASAVGESNRRRAIQMAYNEEHGITPQTVRRAIKDITEGIVSKRTLEQAQVLVDLESLNGKIPPEQLIAEKEIAMREAAHSLEFELAALLRDEIAVLKKQIQLEKTSTPTSKKKKRM